MSVKLPNFLLVGAMKSGTTSIYNYLKEHPQIFLPYKKEPKFFASSPFLKIDNPKYNFQKICNSKPFSSIDDYKNLFKDVKNEVAIGEASPHYLYTYETTIPVIKKYLGDIKIILILRNPADRAFSAYKHNRDYDPGAPHLYEELSFEDALVVETERIKSSNLPMMFFYKSLGLYYDQVNDYKNNFTNVFICTFEELKSDPLLLMKRIYSYLGVEDKFKPNIEIKYNVSSSKKMSYLQLGTNYTIVKILLYYLTKLVGNANLQKIANKILKEDKSTLDNNTKKLLIDEFRVDILKLEKLINKDLSHWLNQ